MNNRMGLGLAVGAGYLLGRTKKAKLAFGIGTLVMGKRLQLNPRAIADFAAAQLAANPQFKEIGEQLREDMRGVGKAATGAILNRQIEGLADRLHDRTQGVQDRMSGVLSGVTGARDERDEEGEEGEEEESADEQSDGEDDAPAKSSSRSSSRSSSSRSASGRSSSGRSSSGRSTSRSSSGGGTASKSRSAGGTAAKSASSKGTSAKKTAQTTQRTAKRATAKKTASRRTAKGGDDRG
ncbi:DNA primase [Streptomyces sp. NPDC048361]|uniref:DNA primase n=1 Tax=Streptomyces sp. NPDC048361 TaxID=3154720 RepID=UPI00342AD627